MPIKLMKPKLITNFIEDNNLTIDKVTYIYDVPECLHDKVYWKIICFINQHLQLICDLYFNGEVQNMKLNQINTLKQTSYILLYKDVPYYEIKFTIDCHAITTDFIPLNSYVNEHEYRSEEDYLIRL